MHVRDLGAGPSVLLLHGTPSPALDWMPIAERLAGSYRVLVPDLPGYGHSPPPGNAQYNAVDEEIAAMLDGRGGRRLHAIAGFSSGAYRAFELVLRRRVTAEVVIGLGAFVTFDQAARDMRRQLAERIEADPRVYYGEDMRAVLRELMLSRGWRERHPEDLERVYRWLDVTTPPAIAAEARAMAELDDLRPELPGLQARVYLRVGELDVAVPPPVSDEIRRLVPRASMDVVPGCGHTLFIEDSQGTVDAIARELGA
jgi:3-oxoadipate enol-lactonase